MSSTTSRELHEQGIALFRKGQFEAALEKFNEALSAKEHNIKHIGEIYNDVGVTYKQLENYSAAHKALDEAMARFIELGDKKGQAQTLGNRASVYEAEGLPDEAVEHYKESASMLEEVGESEMAMYAWQAVSRLRMKQGQYIAAIGAYEEGIDSLPERSLKRRILRQILKMPSRMLGGLGGENEPEQDN